MLAREADGLRTGEANGLSMEERGNLSAQGDEEFTCGLGTRLVNGLDLIHGKTQDAWLPGRR